MHPGVCAGKPRRMQVVEAGVASFDAQVVRILGPEGIIIGLAEQLS